MLSAHSDTVWPVGTLEWMPFCVEGERVFGPGVYDMKAGLVVLLEAVRRASERRRALRIFLTADEEVGSPTGRRLLEQAAEGVAAGFVVEPPGPTGNLKTARKGLGRFTLTVAGRPAHAGKPAEGVSATEELAHQIHALHSLNDEGRGTSVNVGVVCGGTSGNVVAPEAEARFDVRVPDTVERERVEREMAELKPVDPGAPLELDEEASPGGSDGNLLAAVGVPVLDGLGAEGSGACARDEHVVLPSIPLRAELLPRLLREPGL